MTAKIIAPGAKVSAKEHSAKKGIVDQQLIDEYKSGNQSVLSQLYERHYKSVYAVCLRMIKNTTDAQDLAQDVFIQLMRKLDTFRGDSLFSTWLHRMTVNTVLMHFRKKTVRYETESLEQTDEFGISQTGVLETTAVPGTEKESRMSIFKKIEVDNAIRQLPEGYRTVLLLHDVHGYEHEEIARIMNRSSGTSKSQLHKARVKMRKLLNRKAPPRLFRTASEISTANAA